MELMFTFTKGAISVLTFPMNAPNDEMPTVADSRCTGLTIKNSSCLKMQLQLWHFVLAVLPDICHIVS